MSLMSYIVKGGRGRERETEIKRSKIRYEHMPAFQDILETYGNNT